MILKEQATLSSWGNCIGLRITGNLRKIPQFSIGEVVDVEITEQGLSILKQKTTRYTEMELLSDLTPSNAHSDELASLLTSETDY